MKILFLASANPLREMNYIGKPFFRKRIELLPEDFDFQVFTILPNESRITRLVRTLIPKYGQNRSMIKSEIDCENFTWQFRYFNESIFSKIRHKIDIGTKIDAMFQEAEKISNLREFTLIHAQYANSNGLLAYRLKKKYGIPYVIKAHGSDIHTFPFVSSRNRDLVLEALESADKVIFVSNWLLNKAKSIGYCKDNHDVIPNGIDSKIFVPQNRVTIKNELKLGNNVIGFVGNLVPEKRAEKLPEIFTLIRESNPEAQFLIVGSGYLRKKIEKKFKKLKVNVRFTGQVMPYEVPKLMNAMDVIVLPSRNEGWPCIVLEAHACGVPVVGSGNGGIPEAIGDTDFIVSDGANFEQRFADKVCEALENSSIDREKLIKRANEYTWEGVVEKEVAIYREIAGTS